MFKNMPDFNPLYNEVVAYVKEHQGEKGYIDCQPSLKGDIIYAVVYDDFTRCGLEKYVYGVRVVDGDDGLDLECLLVDITFSWRSVYQPEDFKSKEADWLSVRLSDVYFWHTLLNIAKSIEQYGEE